MATVCLDLPAVNRHSGENKIHPYVNYFQSEIYSGR